MALRKNIEFTPNGFDSAASLNNAYIKVDTVSGNKSTVEITVIIYSEKNDQKTPVQAKKYTFTTSMGNKNFIAQAYEHLKTLPEFDGAEDC
jgi:CRISPR/Cas system endoribonuclease Cas6 (RAMP superfamily)